MLWLPAREGVLPKSSTMWWVSYSFDLGDPDIAGDRCRQGLDRALGPYRLVKACAADQGGKVAP